MVKLARLSDAIEVRGRFHRSVQLVKDWRGGGNLGGYLPTPNVRGTASRIAQELRRAGGIRAWSLTGPYGSGKSAFALFLTDLLAGDPPEHQEGGALREELGLDAPPFLPVLVVGQRGPVGPALLRALSEGLEDVDPGLSEKAAALALEARITDEETVALFEAAAAAAEEAGRGGLLVILDEFGKFLEHAAFDSGTEDLFLVQSLAETAARSRFPVVIVTLLHTAFAEYLHPSNDEARRSEWRKVQGRFADVAFREPPEQLLRLVGSAISRRLPKDLEAAYETLVEEAADSSALAEAKRRLPLRDLLPGCVPLDPVVSLLLWPVFRGKLAQNERSLFSFLAGGEPFGFEEFLWLSGLEGAGAPPVYRVDRLYDYITTALGAGVHRGEYARRWAEIDQALGRVAGEAPALASAVVKSVGLIGTYGAAVGLRASEETLSLALGDQEGVRAALEYLKRKSVVVYRRHEGAYGLWEGSDVDLDEAFDEALQRLGGGALAERLRRSVSLRPMVARAHYVEKGTLRYFEVCMIEGDEEAIERASEAETSADGVVTFVLCQPRERAALLERARELTCEAPERRLRIFAFPEPMFGLEEALRDVEAWMWVKENVRVLQGDAVARRELGARLDHARRRLESVAGGVLGLRGHRFDPSASAWVQGGELHELCSARRFSRWLSRLCDEAYAGAPTLQNELLNRERLSSAAAKARRNLIEAMIEHGGEHRLGLQGTPPEVSMYEAFLVRGGFHREVEGVWGFHAPDGDWRPLWNAVGGFLSSTEGGPRSVSELLGLLRRPPFGLRSGPFPVLLCAVMLGLKNDVALYDGGVFVPEPSIELFERLLRHPEKFEIRRFALSEQDRAALEAAGRVVGTLRSEPDLGMASEIVEIVKPMVLFADRLPAYAKRTRRLDPPEAVALREALLGATDPYELLFENVPAALGVPIDRPDRIAKFAEALRGCLLGLRRAYPRLLDELESEFREALHLWGSDDEVRERLRERCVPLVDLAGNQTTGVFVREASNLSGKDWREALARTLKDGVPPREWRDRDLAVFRIRLQEVASDLTRLGELATERRCAGEGTRVLRIGILDDRAHEARAVIFANPERASEILELVGRIEEVLQGYPASGEEGRRTQLAALAEVVMERLRANGRNHDS